MPWYAILSFILLGIFGIVSLLFLFAVKPNRRRDASDFTGVFFAHRGLHDGTGKIPENSMVAFARAKEAGYGVEFDVQMTKDKKLVVFHDQTLKRMCGVDVKLNTLTYEELQQYTLLDGEEKIPTLAQVLDFLEDVPICCELKYYRKLDDPELCEMVDALLNTYKGSVCVESFSPFIVRWFRKNNPSRIRGQLASNLEFEELPYWVHVAVGHLVINIISRPDFVSYHFADRTIGLRICRRVFKPLLFGWTFRDNEEIRESAEKGYQSFIFEHCLPEDELIIE